jgi:hypothetical protein
VAELFARGVVIGGPRRLARAIAGALRGDPPIRDVFYLRHIGWICRQDVGFFTEYAVARWHGQIAVWLFLTRRANSLIMVSRKYVYSDAEDADQIGRDAANRFWAFLIR